MGVAVLVHGGWVGAECWNDVAERLRSRGHRVEAVALHRGSLEADTQAVQDVLDEVGEPLVVCGWSYGGVVITGVQVPLGSELIYLSAFMPDAGESVLSLGVGYPGPIDHLIQVEAGGALSLVGEELDAVLWADATQEDQETARSWLRTQAARCFAGTPGRVAWRECPSTYVLGSADRAFHPDLLRRFSTRATHVVEWPTSHSALLVRPDLVAELIDSVAGRLPGAPELARRPVGN